MLAPDGSRITRVLLRIMGGFLLVLSVFPVYRGLDTSGDVFRVASVEIAETNDFVTTFRCEVIQARRRARSPVGKQRVQVAFTG